MRWKPCSQLILPFSIVLFACAAPAFPQQQKHDHSAETTPRVPALEIFHTVIFKIWHDAWPKKDYGTLTALLPEIEEGAASIAKAELPGILREKKSAWDRNVKKLQEVVTDYRKASETKQDQKLLEAAEQLHSQYETLVRTLRPVVKEVEQFHAVLYLLYHHYVPENTVDSIKVSAVRLKGKMAELNNATLPERLKSRTEAFEKARRTLSGAIDAFSAAVASGDEKEIQDALKSVHTNYQSLETIFE